MSENTHASVPYESYAQSYVWEVWQSLPWCQACSLWILYKDLAGDCSDSHDSLESVVDECVCEILTMEPEDPRTLVDLREVWHKESKTKFDVFWDEARKYNDEDLGVAVDDRRQSEVTHLGKAISIRDLIEQVGARCPADTAIPSEEWIRLQFWPKTPKARVSLQYTGWLKVHFMVQKRQFRKSYEDEHYAAAIFHYLREYVIRLKDYCMLVCIDDKHRLKVGEPGCPVATAGRGKRVLVWAGTTFKLGDHDFTIFYIQHCSLCNTCSWYFRQHSGVMVQRPGIFWLQGHCFWTFSSHEACCRTFLCIEL